MHVPPPKQPGSTRFVVIADTHLLHADVLLPGGDVLVHCGDILVEDRGLDHHGWRALLDDFNAWLGRQTHLEERLVTGGNHDQVLEDLGTPAV